MGRKVKIGTLGLDPRQAAEAEMRRKLASMQRQLVRAYRAKYNANFGGPAIEVGPDSPDEVKNWKIDPRIDPRIPPAGGSPDRNVHGLDGRG